MRGFTDFIIILAHVLILSLFSGKIVAQSQPSDKGELAQLMENLSVVPHKKGVPAADFTLPDLQGNQVQLKNIKKKMIILHFWATWCGPCREELPELEAFYRGLDKSKFALFAISADTGGKSVVTQFLAGKNYTMPILLDSSGRVTGQYQVRAFPSTYLLDGNMRIVAEINGARSWKAKEVAQLFHIISQTADIAKAFQGVSEKVDFSQVAGSKKLTPEVIEKTLPRFDIKTTSDKSSYFLNDTINFKIVFSWTGQDMMSFFIKPPKLPKLPGLKILKTRSASKSSRTQKSLSYEYQMKAEKEGAYSLNPIEMEYMIMGYDETVKRKAKGLTIKVTPRLIMGLTYLQFSGTLFIILSVLGVLIIVRNRKNQLRVKTGERVKDLKNTLDELNDIYQKMRESSLKKDHPLFMQQIISISKVMAPTSLPNKLKEVFVLDEEKISLHTYGGGQFSSSELSYFLAKAEDCIKEFEKINQEEGITS